MPAPLPIDLVLPDVLSTLKTSRSLVLIAPPGAGKTTRVPPAILQSRLLSPDHPNVVMLQPRRVAARASAMRMADENNWELGREVGYHVRFDRKIGRDTRLRVLTEGILTRQLVDDPFLEGVGCVILDEFHERNLNTDLCIALLREIQQTVRGDLFVVVMSATLDAEPVAAFLDNCPILRSEGRTFPVHIEYRPDPRNQYLDTRVAEILREVIAEADDSGGDVLVFLPGAGEINSVLRKVETPDASKKLLVLPLHGSLSAEEQIRALRPAPPGLRKIVLATNIAETSLTIDGVTTVIDAGLARIAGFDAQRGLDRLDLSRISKASATQRAGRAGRTAPGRCIRMWSAKEHEALDDFELPEIQRVDLAGTVLQLHAWGKPDTRAFGWFQAPSEEAIGTAERLLARLGAITSETNGTLTPVGRRMVATPVHPRLARLLLAAASFGRGRDGATLAALLSEKDFVLEDRSQPRHLRTPTTQAASDVLHRLDLLDRAERATFAAYLFDEGIDPAAARQVVKIRDELLRVTRSGDTRAEDHSDNLLMRLILLAYPDRVCRRRSEHADTAVTVGGSGVKLAPESVVRSGEFFVAVDARHDERSRTREAVVRVASRIEPAWLEELFPQSVRKTRTLLFDEPRGRVVALDQTFYLDLPLRENKDAPVDPIDAGVVLTAALRPTARDFFRSNESAENLLARVALLREQMPEHGWPVLDDELLGDLLDAACAGRRSVEEVRRQGLVNILEPALPYPLDRLLAQHAPETMTVPSGSQIRIDYAVSPPVLAVRLQELFGLTETPRIAGGRLPLRLHLLAPNYRPVQVTEDLKSFWSTTYFQVRKDLRARYPKHSWPDDPLTAPPQAKGRPRS